MLCPATKRVWRIPRGISHVATAVTVGKWAEIVNRLVHHSLKARIERHSIACPPHRVSVVSWHAVAAAVVHARAPIRAVVTCQCKRLLLHTIDGIDPLCCLV